MKAIEGRTVRHVLVARLFQDLTLEESIKVINAMERFMQEGYSFITERPSSEKRAALILGIVRDLDIGAKGFLQELKKMYCR